jgi:hypothetical protein
MTSSSCYYVSPTHHVFQNNIILTIYNNSRYSTKQCNSQQKQSQSVVTLFIIKYKSLSVIVNLSTSIVVYWMSFIIVICSFEVMLSLIERFVYLISLFIFISLMFLWNINHHIKGENEKNRENPRTEHNRGTKHTEHTRRSALRTNWEKKKQGKNKQTQRGRTNEKNPEKTETTGHRGDTDNTQRTLDQRPQTKTQTQEQR